MGLEALVGESPIWERDENGGEVNGCLVHVASLVCHVLGAC